MTARHIVTVAVIIPGLLGMMVFGYYSLVDWNALQNEYVDYQTTVTTSFDPTTIDFAYQMRSIHRLNLFAEGVWTLLSAILAAIGLCSVGAAKANELPTTGRPK